jgi:hypothetical protein
VLGGGRGVRDEQEAAGLTELHRALERLNHEYAAAERLAGMGTELRAGQIIGTSALLAIRARMALGTDGPGPFARLLCEPRAGVLAGHGQFHWVDPDVPGRGGRWLLMAQDGQRYPLALDTLLHGSGVEKDGAAIEIRSGRTTDAAMIITAASAAAAARARTGERSLDFQKLVRYLQDTCICAAGAHQFSIAHSGL